MKSILLTVISVLLCMSLSAQNNDDDFFNMSIEELMQIEVISVSQEGERQEHSDSIICLIALVDEDDLFNMGLEDLKQIEIISVSKEMEYARNADSINYLIALVDEDDLLNMELEDLMQIEIISVSIAVESQYGIDSALYLITQEDIRSSGVTRLEEILQIMVPELFSVHNNYNEVGFGRGTQEKGIQEGVLVLVNSIPFQSADSPADDFVDFDLDEIDRIELVRRSSDANTGTGAINIITKN